MEFPILSFQYQMPRDGLPLFPQWINNASDLFNVGFEKNREPFEIYLANDKVEGKYGEIFVSKGQGRLSVIWFGILYSYFHLQKELACDDVKEDLTRHVGKGPLA